VLLNVRPKTIEVFAEFEPFDDLKAIIMKTNSGMGMTHNLVRLLGQSIVSGDYDKKPFPTEADLSINYSSSRTVTREAVKMLTAKGLLSSKPRNGTKVEPIDQWNLLDPDVIGWMMQRPYSAKLFADFTHMRLAVEPHACALAAQRQDKDDIAQIRHHLEQMRESSDHSQSVLEADIDFHVAILKASGNVFFWQLKELTRVALNISISLTNKIAGHTADIEAHEHVLINIEQGKAEQAEAAMTTILEDALHLIQSQN